jgi:hypothetical protein
VGTSAEVNVKNSLETEDRCSLCGSCQLVVSMETKCTEKDLLNFFK